MGRKNRGSTSIITLYLRRQPSANIYVVMVTYMNESERERVREK